jgi:hypothetical protein
MRMMKMLSSPTQLIDFASRHFSCIDESVYADIRELPYSMGHAPAQGLLEPIVTAIALIVHETILLLTLSNGGRHSWKQKEAEAGNRNTTAFGPHSINSICLLGFRSFGSLVGEVEFSALHGQATLEQPIAKAASCSMRNMPFFSIRLSNGDNDYEDIGCNNRAQHPKKDVVTHDDRRSHPDSRHRSSKFQKRTLTVTQTPRFRSDAAKAASLTPRVS